MRLPVHIWIREENACPREIAGYFVRLAQRMDETPRPMRLTVESTVPVTLDFDPKDGDPVVAVKGERHRFRIRRRWLPEHPVPLEFGRRKTVLLLDPAGGNRFRVRFRRFPSVPGWAYAVLAVSGTFTAVTLHPAAFCMTAVTALCIGGGFLVSLAHRLGKRHRKDIDL